MAVFSLTRVGGVAVFTRLEGGGGGEEEEEEGDSQAENPG